jgi:hypothetical protein
VGTPIGELIRPVPYRAIQSLIDGSAVPGTHAYWRSHQVAELSDPAIDTVVSFTQSLPSAMSLLHGWVIGGAMSRVAPDATAVGPRLPGYELQFVAAWSPSDPNGESHRAWAREGWEALRPYSAGQYATFLSDEGSDGVRTAFGDRLARLAALKDRYDPDNFFRFNANIPTTIGATR